MTERRRVVAIIQRKDDHIAYVEELKRQRRRRGR